MEVLRRSEKIRINLKIKEAEQSIKRDEEAMDRLKHSDAFSAAYREGQVKEKIARIDGNNAVIEEMTRRLDALSSGLLDKQLEKAVEKSQQLVSTTLDLKKRKKVAIDEENKVRNDKTQALWAQNKQDSRDCKDKKRDMDRTYKFFCKTNDTIPNYMLKKLADMPSNKGYIWRGIYCYGEMPAENNKTVVMFEKGQKDTLIIHEWSPEEYRVYQKDGKNRKVLLEKHSREKRKQGGASLMDYVKS